MNHNFGLKQLLGWFVVCLILYFIVFYGIEHMRNRKGPWELTFTSAPDSPAVVIEQSTLNIHGVKILIPSATATNLTITNPNWDFDQARPVPFDVPYGKCVGLDTITMPGTVELKLNGHDIQLLPRVLTIDGQEHAWQSGLVIALPPK